MKNSQPTGITQEQVLNSLRSVLDPDLHKDIVTLGMIHDVEIKGNEVSFRFVLTTPACPVREQLQEAARQAVHSLQGVERVNVKMDSKVPRHHGASDKKAIEGVRNIIAVTSGKGGVGKTTVAVNLACALAASSARVGLLDCDIYGPNVPIMLGLSGRPVAEQNRIVPLEAFGLRVMSMGFLAEGDTPLIWRGPMLHSVIQQFLYQVAWGELDYLIVDLPPGTGDAQLTIMQSVPLMGGIVVTTPQDVALADARKGIMMFKQVNVTILGVIENMSYFVCPHCGARSDIFSHGGGEETSRRYRVPFLGSIPLQTEIRVSGDSGMPIVLDQSATVASRAFRELAEKLAARVSTVNLENQPVVQLQS